VKITANGARLEYADNSASFLTALNRGDRFAEIPAGPWRVDGRKFASPEWQKVLNTCFTFIGTTAANGVPQYASDGHPKALSKLVVTGLKEGEPCFPLKGQAAGHQQFLNMLIERDTAGPVIQDDKTAAFDVLKTGGRGLKLDGVGISTGRNVPNYCGLYQGGELPASTGAAIDLYNRADVEILNTSVTGFETQLQLDMCEATVDNWRGMTCGRSIVVTGGFVPVTITSARIENVLISGIDGSCVDIAGVSVEVGYETKVGYRPVPNDADLSKYVPGRCVAIVGGMPVYVEKTWPVHLTHYLSDSHCQLPAGPANPIVPILGIPFILRGDGNSLTRWTPNINQPIDLPVAALAPFRKPTKVSHLNVGLMSGWANKQRALYIGDDKPRQFAFQRGVQWNDEPTYAPVHPFVYGMAGPGFDPNKRGTA
jgi:hypothetical protein